MSGIYKDCDIRGIYREELTDRDAYVIGRSLLPNGEGKTLAIGADVRVSTPLLKRELMRGIRDSGVSVCDLGILPTPAFYFALKKLDVAGGVMVTASHNPPKYNGFKLMLGDIPVTPGDIGALELRTHTLSPLCAKAGRYSEHSVLKDYADSFKTFPRGSLKVVIDACNGCMSYVAPQVFHMLGYKVTPLFCEYDGRFPNRDPNPAVYSNLTKLCESVCAVHADLGVAFDGDGDRVVFVDEKGNPVQSERALALLIGELDAPTVVYDQKSSSVVKRAAINAGGKAIPQKSGHAYIKTSFLENNAAIAGEISGHFFFKELGYDDGLYAALKIAMLISRQDAPLSVLLKHIPATLITPDIRLGCAYDEQNAALAAVEAIAPERVGRLDGVRLEWEKGWLICRKSVTEQAITLRAEADDPDTLMQMCAELCRALPQYAGAIADNFKQTVANAASH